MRRRRRISTIFPSSKEHPLESAGFFSRWYFTWIKEVLSISSMVPWEQDMHYDLTSYDSVPHHKSQIEQGLKKYKSIMKMILHVYKWELIQYCIASVVMTTLNFSSSFFIGNVIHIIQTNKEFTSEKITKDLILNFGSLACVITVSALIQSYYKFKANRLSFAIRCSLLAIAQDKVMNFSVLNSSKITEGQITNFFQVDINRASSLLLIVAIILSGISTSILGFSYLWFLMDGEIVWVLFGGFMFLFTLNLTTYYFRAKFTKQTLTKKDRRMTFFRNVIQNIEAVKMRVLENFYCLKIFKKREKEVEQLQKNAYIGAVSQSFNYIIPSSSTLFMLLYFTFWRPERHVKYETYVAFNQVFDTIKTQFFRIVSNVNFMVEIWVSFKRIDQFFNSQNRDEILVLMGDSGQNTQKEDKKLVIKVEQGNFRWKKDIGQVSDFADQNIQDEDESKLELSGNKSNLTWDSQSLLSKTESVESMQSILPLLERTDSSSSSSSTSGANFRLHNLNFEISQGEKIVVLGKSSSGKSSLLYCMLGEMIKDHPSCKVSKYTDKFCLLSQGRWALGDTIAENITLGEKYDQNFMKKVLKVSQLAQDIENLNHGLDTIMGDTGDTVSGGQRARIGLARCFYQK